MFSLIDVVILTWGETGRQKLPFFIVVLLQNRYDSDLKAWLTILLGKRAGDNIIVQKIRAWKSRPEHKGPDPLHMKQIYAFNTV